jgi:hypothetical protein
LHPTCVRCQDKKDIFDLGLLTIAVPDQFSENPGDVYADLVHKLPIRW